MLGASLVFMTACSGCAKKAEPAAAPSAVGASPEGEREQDEDETASDEQGNEGDEEALPLPAHPGAHRTDAKLAGAAALTAEANRQLSIMRRSLYTHKTQIDEPTGLFEYDCSGFLDYSLANVAPDALADLRRATVKRPLAKHFVAFFESIPQGGKTGGWRRVGRVVDMVPGDVIAWLKPADVVSKNTGHVMIVRAAPVQARAQSGDVTALTVTVPIYDSTSVRHGKGDSRLPSRATGLGTGEILVMVDQGGRPLRYRWSHGKKAREHVTTIAMGHLD
jgi:hypothetical protein